MFFLNIKNNGLYIIQRLVFSYKHKNQYFPYRANKITCRTHLQAIIYYLNSLSNISIFSGCLKSSREVIPIRANTSSSIPL